MWHAFVALLIVGALLPGATVAGTSNKPEACVLSFSAAMGRQWETLLRPYRFRARSWAVTTVQPDQLRNCDVRVVSSDTSLFWRSDPEAAGRLLAGRPAVVMGAASRPVLEALLPELAAATSEAKRRGRRLSVEPQGKSLLEAPFRIPVEGAGKSLVLCRDESALVALATAARRSATALTVYCTEQGAPVVFRSGDTIFWGITSSPDGLTAAGRTLFANLVHSLAPAPSASPRKAARKPRTASTSTSQQSRTSPPARVIAAARAQQAPQLDFAATANRGPRSIRAMRGDVTLVVFWATWCGPCKRAMPDVVALAKQLDREGIEVVGVSIDADPDKAIAYAKRNGYRLPISVAGPGAQKRFGLSGIPSAALLDRKGRVRGTYSGGDLEASGAANAARHVRQRG